MVHQSHCKRKQSFNNAYSHIKLLHLPCSRFKSTISVTTSTSSKHCDWFLQIVNMVNPDKGQKEQKYAKIYFFFHIQQHTKMALGKKEWSWDHPKH